MDTNHADCPVCTFGEYRDGATRPPRRTDEAEAMTTWTIDNQDGLNDPEDDVGGCEHGDHPNRDPAGNRRVCEKNHRFCSPECAACELEEFDTETFCCAGLCGFPNKLRPDADHGN